MGRFDLNPFMSMSHPDYINANSVVTVQNWVINSIKGNKFAVL